MTATPKICYILVRTVRWKGKFCIPSSQPTPASFFPKSDIFPLSHNEDQYFQRAPLSYFLLPFDLFTTGTNFPLISIFSLLFLQFCISPLFVSSANSSPQNHGWYPTPPEGRGGISPCFPINSEWGYLITSKRYSQSWCRTFTFSLSGNCVKSLSS